MKILIAYDGTPGSRAVFSDLRRAGLPTDTNAVVLSVATAGRVPTARALLLDEARLLAEAGAGYVRTAFPSWTVTPEVVEGSPAQAIVAAGERFGSALVVTGTRGLNERQRAELGSVAREVVTSARTSVRVSRPASRGDADPTRLLLGFDGSAGADDAVAAVCARKWPRGTEVHLIAARPTPSKAKAEGDGPSRTPKELEHALDEAAARLTKAGLVTTTAMRVGEPERTLLDEAVTWTPDAIFVGGRRLQRLRRFLFGSIAGAVADDAPCTVEVVRVPAGQ